jgi:hypothetical protein
MATSIVGRARVFATTACVFRVLGDEALNAARRFPHDAVRRPHHRRFRFCNGVPEGCTVRIRAISLPKASRDVRLQASRVAMPQSRVTLTKYPQRFTVPTEQSHFSKLPLQLITLHDGSDKKIKCVAPR